METLSRSLIEHAVEGVILQATFPFFMRGEYPVFCVCKHAVKTAQHGHGQHHPLVLRWTVRPTQEVGDLPDKIGELVMVGHRRLRQAGISSHDAMYLFLESQQLTLFEERKNKETEPLADAVVRSWPTIAR